MHTFFTTVIQPDSSPPCSSAIPNDVDLAFYCSDGIPETLLPFKELILDALFQLDHWDKVMPNLNKLLECLSQLSRVGLLTLENCMRLSKEIDYIDQICSGLNNMNRSDPLFMTQKHLEFLTAYPFWADYLGAIFNSMQQSAYSLTEKDFQLLDKQAEKAREIFQALKKCQRFVNKFSFRLLVNCPDQAMDFSTILSIVGEDSPKKNFCNKLMKKKEYAKTIREALERRWRGFTHDQIIFMINHPDQAHSLADFLNTLDSTNLQAWIGPVRIDQLKRYPRRAVMIDILSLLHRYESTLKPEEYYAILIKYRKNAENLYHGIGQFANNKRSKGLINPTIFELIAKHETTDLRISKVLFSLYVVSPSLMGKLVSFLEYITDDCLVENLSSLHKYNPDLVTEENYLLLKDIGHKSNIHNALDLLGKIKVQEDTLERGSDVNFQSSRLLNTQQNFNLIIGNEGDAFSLARVLSMLYSHARRLLTPATHELLGANAKNIKYLALGLDILCYQTPALITAEIVKSILTSNFASYNQFKTKMNELKPITVDKSGVQNDFTSITIVGHEKNEENLGPKYPGIGSSDTDSLTCSLL